MKAIICPTCLHLTFVLIGLCFACQSVENQEIQLAPSELPCENVKVDSLFTGKLQQYSGFRYSENDTTYIRFANRKYPNYHISPSQVRFNKSYAGEAIEKNFNNTRTVFNCMLTKQNPDTFSFVVDEISVEKMDRFYPEIHRFLEDSVKKEWDKLKQEGKLLHNLYGEKILEDRYPEHPETVKMGKRIQTFLYRTELANFVRVYFKPMGYQLIDVDFGSLTYIDDFELEYINKRVEKRNIMSTPQDRFYHFLLIDFKLKRMD